MMTQTTRPVIAAFDFDKTITRCDTLLPFLLYTKGVKALWALFLSLPAFIAFVINRNRRQQAKETVLTHIFAGTPIATMRELGVRYAKEKLPCYVHADALKRIAWHKSQGHRVILISANLEVYLNSWAKAHQVDDVIASRLQLDDKGCVTGKLEEGNCWGEEKVKRLLNLVGPRDTFTLYAYGDSHGDAALLATADYPYYRHIPITEAS